MCVLRNTLVRALLCRKVSFNDTRVTWARAHTHTHRTARHKRYVSIFNFYYCPRRVFFSSNRKGLIRSTENQQFFECTKHVTTIAWCYVNTRTLLFRVFLTTRMWVLNKHTFNLIRTSELFPDFPPPQQ